MDLDFDLVRDAQENVLFFFNSEFPLLYLCVRLFIVGFRLLLGLHDVCNTLPMQMLTAFDQH